MLRALARLPFLAVRQLRWRKGAWSKDSDRQYHEHLYEAQDYDAFRSSYPGYVTIRRFADHAEVLMPATGAAGAVLDIGCGPGEITCELARRHPHLSFLGIDHSAQAIKRATRNAARLGLANIRFEAISAEELPAGDRYGLVLIFDAFHHLEQPREFLTWLRARTSRVVLIEPAGTWTGRWARNLDVDWLLDDLANIRERLEALCGAATHHAPAPAPESAAPPAQGEGAVERRYALDDFQDFFRDWQLRITGTIAGFDRYPPAAHAESALRPVTGDLAYALVRATEDALRERDHDGAAKHWVIAATTEAGVLKPRLPGRTNAAMRASEMPASRVASAYDVRYQRYDGPAEAAAGEEFHATVGILNAGWDEWRSDGDHPVHVSYHWLKPNGGMVEFDGVRTALPRALGPGESCDATVIIRAPGAAGDYMLAIDLVKEGVTWFSEAGKPWHSVRVAVTDR